MFLPSSPLSECARNGKFTNGRSRWITGACNGRRMPGIPGISGILNRAERFLYRGIPPRRYFPRRFRWKHGFFVSLFFHFGYSAILEHPWHRWHLLLSFCRAIDCEVLLPVKTAVDKVSATFRPALIAGCNSGIPRIPRISVWWWSEFLTTFYRVLPSSLQSDTHASPSRSVAHLWQLGHL